MAFAFTGVPVEQLAVVEVQVINPDLLNPDLTPTIPKPQIPAENNLGTPLVSRREI